VAVQSVNFGQPRLDQVVGRSDVLGDIHRALERGSHVLLTGERRIGKSWVLSALAAQPPTGWKAIYTDVEPIGSIDSLIDVLAERITSRLPATRKAIERALSSGVTEVKGVPVPQRPDLAPVDRLRRLIRATVADGERLVLILDELPILAQRLEERSPGTALELLQLLRALRMEEPRLRQVLAGSIGFHHLLAGDAEIRAAVNDLLAIPIGPLARGDAAELASRLLAGVGLPTTPGSPAVDAVIAATDAVPFYIQHCVSDLERQNVRVLEAAHVDDVRRRALYGADDPWQLRHYADRVPSYFGPLTAMALAALDAIASVDEGLGTDDIANRVRTDRDAADGPPVTNDALRSVLRRLELDHYLAYDPETRRYQFTLRIVRDAWRAIRFR
jgi:hypothetical protein